MAEKDEVKSKKKYTILFISTYQNYFVNTHASFSRMYNLLKYFNNHKDFKVIILQPLEDREKENKSLKKDIKVYYFKNFQIFNYNLVPLMDFNPYFILKVKQILKKHEIDLIHIDYLYGINILGLITRLPISYNAYNVESIYAEEVGKFYKRVPKTVRNLYSKYIYYLEKCALKKVNNLNAISEFDKNQFIKIYKVNPSKIIVSPIGYKEEIYKNPIKKEKAREFLNISQEKFCIIFHGSYSINYANKEAIFLIENYICPKFKDQTILFLIAGRMPKSKKITNLRFLGFQEDLRYFLYSADIAIVPILRGSGVKTKIIDYFSANIPVITSVKGAEGLYLEDNKHGYIVNNIVEDIIEKIKYLKNNPAIIKQFQKNIKKIVMEKYSWEKIAFDLIQRYKEIIEKIK